MSCLLATPRNLSEIDGERPADGDADLVRAVADEGLEAGVELEAPVGHQQLDAGKEAAVEVGRAAEAGRAVNEKARERLEEGIDVRCNPQVELEEGVESKQRLRPIVAD